MIVFHDIFERKSAFDTTR